LLAGLLGLTVAYGRALDAAPPLGDPFGRSGLLTAQLPEEWRPMASGESGTGVVAAFSDETGLAVYVRLLSGANATTSEGLLNRLYRGQVRIPTYAGLRGRQIDGPRSARIAGDDGVMATYVLIDRAGQRMPFFVTAIARPLRDGRAVVVEVARPAYLEPDGADGVLAKAVAETVRVD
jgi:hypothetical protein